MEYKMSYNVIAYQVNSAKIQSIWGSNDLEFVDTFLIQYSDKIEDLVDELGEEDNNLYKTCLIDIVKGEITHCANDYIYGYLYELICQKFGEIIESDEFMSYLEDVTPYNHKAFIPIPKNDDWPEFYSVYFNELENTRKSFLGLAKDYAKEDYFLEEINNIFDTAIKNKMDLVFFAY